jgi:hypothetical protein
MQSGAHVVQGLMMKRVQQVRAASDLRSERIGLQLLKRLGAWQELTPIRRPVYLIGEKGASESPATMAKYMFATRLRQPQGEEVGVSKFGDVNKINEGNYKVSPDTHICLPELLKQRLGQEGEHVVLGRRGIVAGV